MLGTGAVVLWYDIVPQEITAHDEWHTREHMPERVDIPGFLRASRWVAPASPRYFILYEVRDGAVPTSRDYLDRLERPTAWTQAMMPAFRNMRRGYCNVTAGFGTGFGGSLRWIWLDPAPSEQDHVRETIVRHHLPQLKTEAGVASACLLEPAATPPMTAEQTIRGADAPVAWVLLITMLGGASVDAWYERAVRSNAFGSHPPRCGTHMLDYTLVAQDSAQGGESRAT